MKQTEIPYTEYLRIRSDKKSKYTEKELNPWIIKLLKFILETPE